MSIIMRRYNNSPSLLLLLSMKLFVFAIASFIVTDAYVVPSSIRWMSSTTTQHRQLQHQKQRHMVIDPILFGAGTGLNIDIAMEVGIAAVSAAAGAMTQLPRIQELQRELESTKSLLSTSEAELVTKIRVLEDKLFVMDQEFEEQTVRFQRQYDTKQKEQLEQYKEKLKRDMAFKLDIQIEQDRSSKLLQQANIENNRTSKQEELSQLKLQQIRLNDLNAKLEQSIKESDDELTRLREEVSKKKKFLFW